MRNAIAALLTLTALGCGGAAEHTLLTQFFAASRLRDLTALHRYATVVFEPASDGIVTSFEIQRVSKRDGAEDVWLTAPVKLPDGRMVSKAFTVTIQGGLVTAISERQAAASTPPR